MPMRYIFHGHVQGVGFRYTTRQIARRFPVTGYVKNLSDGTVELVVEGETEDIELFVSAIQERFSGNLTGKDTEEVITGEQYNSFEIRR